LLQEFNYEVVVKSGKSNSNADYLSWMQGLAAVEDISSNFPDEFPEEGILPEVGVFQVGNQPPSEFKDVIDYLTTRKYPEGMTREEKNVFQHRVAPFTMVFGVLFRMALDDKITRCLESGE
jgi:hypothetical protein